MRFGLVALAILVLVAIAGGLYFALQREEPVVVDTTIKDPPGTRAVDLFLPDANGKIRRETRRKFSADEKIRIVLEGLKGEASIAELCRREGISPNLYYRGSKNSLEACVWKVLSHRI